MSCLHSKISWFLFYFQKIEITVNLRSIHDMTFTCARRKRDTSAHVNAMIVHIPQWHYWYFIISIHSVIYYIFSYSLQLRATSLNMYLLCNNNLPSEFCLYKINTYWQIMLGFKNIAFYMENTAFNYRFAQYDYYLSSSDHIWSKGIVSMFAVSLIQWFTEQLIRLFDVWWCSGAASEAGDGAQRGGEKQREAAQEPPGAHGVHTHAEDHTDLHPQPHKSECVSF